MVSQAAREPQKNLSASGFADNEGFLYRAVLTDLPRRFQKGRDEGLDPPTLGGQGEGQDSKQGHGAPSAIRPHDEKTYIMGKRNEFRAGKRRRGFDDDDDAFDSRPRRDSDRFRPARGIPAETESFPSTVTPQPMVPAPHLEATVKWFNGEKGFGFVELSDGSGDVFLHIAVLQNAGRDSVAPGAKMQVEVGQGPKGRQVVRVIDVDESTAVAEPPRRPMRAPVGRVQPDPSTAVELTGAVKWFNGTKGFGFVGADDAGKDVFVHASVLERSGMPELAEGQRIRMRVVQTPKGREAISIEPTE